MFLKSYIVIGSLVCLWYSIAAASGWKAPAFAAGSGFSSGSSSGGGFFYTGGRSTSGSGGWGGGK